MSTKTTLQGYVANVEAQTLWTRDATGRWRKYKPVTMRPTAEQIQSGRFIEFYFDEPDCAPLMPDPGVGTDSLLVEVPIAGTRLPLMEQHLAYPTDGQRYVSRLMQNGDSLPLGLDRPNRKANMSGKSSGGNGGNGTMDKKGFFGAIAEAAVESGKKAIPAIGAQAAIKAGTNYAVLALKDSHPDIARMLNSDGGRAAMRVLLPLLGVGIAAQFPDNAIAAQFGNIMEPALDAGMIESGAVVAERLVFPMAAVMLNAAGVGGLLNSGAINLDDKIDLEALPTSTSSTPKTTPVEPEVVNAD